MSQHHNPIPQQPSMNIAAIVGFVLSLLGFNIVAVIVGAVGLSQIKKRGQRGRGFAIAAIVIGAIACVGVVLSIILQMNAGV
ncbi:DUF4190 domain-containing protein [Leucobacter ruminantium]|uniref:DUF4190 domain-containing protein n=1 Tax=Leucobacter ruminantium TaxID=1289170 RepID=A0A939RXS9_9MICO|nr:DUF4190 domain-containing protein [Leucobacter ruminantium]MBO1806482.1 DUF4190 domain-containing protein [Leucobacter ruminantium]